MKCFSVFILIFSFFSPPLVAKECAGVVGDVKLSLLSETTFRKVNGSCWKLMDGRKIPGSQLSEFEELSHFEGALPDATGQFLRALDTSRKIDKDGVGGSARAVGSLQLDALKNHTHSNGKTNIYKWDQSFAGKHTGPDVLVNRKEPRSSLFRSNETGSFGTSTYETRPKNIALFLYVNIGECYRDTGC
ncbi:MAG: hypothetical protein OIF51_04625 [Cellvibrionaceae bacterium]|nr:hypothetical protein [Cellvibrionaceae bacterium]